MTVHTVRIDPEARQRLDELVAEMGRYGWRASGPDIVAALILFIPGPAIVGLTRELNIQRARRRRMNAAS